MYPTVGAGAWVMCQFCRKEWRHGEETAIFLRRSALLLDARATVRKIMEAENVKSKDVLLLSFNAKRSHRWTLENPFAAHPHWGFHRCWSCDIPVLTTRCSRCRRLLYTASDRQEDQERMRAVANVIEAAAEEDQWAFWTWFLSDGSSIVKRWHEEHERQLNGLEISAMYVYDSDVEETAGMKRLGARARRWRPFTELRTAFESNLGPLTERLGGISNTVAAMRLIRHLTREVGVGGRFGRHALFDGHLDLELWQPPEWPIAIKEPTHREDLTAYFPESFVVPHKRKGDGWGPRAWDPNNVNARAGTSRGGRGRQKIKNSALRVYHRGERRPVELLNIKNDAAAAADFISQALTNVPWRLDELVSTVKRGRLTAEERERYDALAVVVVQLRERGAHLEAIGDALGKGSTTVRNLEARGRVLTSQAN